MTSMKNAIPESVLKEAKGLIDLYGNTLEYLGDYNGYDVYLFAFPENKETGFPFVYIHDTDSNVVLEVTGFRALDIIGKFKEQI